MFEIERKFTINKEKWEEISRYLNEEKTSISMNQKDKIFLLKCDSFKKFKPGDPVIRLRSQDQKSSLTYKRKINESGDVMEYELAIDSLSVAQDMLLDMGYLVVSDIEKNRTEFHIEGINICLDDVVGLGLFLEIEILSDSAEQMSAAEEKIMSMAAKFDLSAADIEKRKYDELIEQKNHAHVV